MFQPRSIQSSLSFRDKLMLMDFPLVFSVLLLGIVSMFAMYSTDGGKFDYHTKSHIMRFSVFFIMFFIISFSKLDFGIKQALFYILVFSFYYLE